MKTKNIIIRPLRALPGQIFRWGTLFVLTMVAVPLASLIEAQPAAAADTGNIEGVVYNSTNGLPVGAFEVRITPDLIRGASIGPPRRTAHRSSSL